MLEGLITSKTRIKMLLKFFLNSDSTAYLRGLAEEFGESTNSIRHELNNLSKAGYLVSNENGRTIEYRANTHHPLFPEIKSLVHKYLGIDKVIENVIRKLGDLKAAYLIGDYARGKDSGTLEVLLVGSVDEAYVQQLMGKARKLIHRAVEVKVVSVVVFEAERERYQPALLLWLCD